MERRLWPHQRLLLGLHLLICAACMRFKTQLLLLRQAVRQRLRQLEGQHDSDMPALPPDARARIKRALRVELD